MIVLYDDPNKYTPNLWNSSGTVLVTLAYMNRYGWSNSQEYILDCIKSGNLNLPFLVDPQGSHSYIDRMQNKI